MNTVRRCPRTSRVVMSLCIGAGLLSAAMVATAASVPGRDDDQAPAEVEDPREIGSSQLRRLLRMSRPRDFMPDSTNLVADSREAARLGQILFFEPRLSANNEVSCATCHDPQRGFTDGRRLAMGLSEGTRNTQTLLDISDFPFFTWDGRADSLWSQALHPFEDPAEMGLTRFEVIERIRAIPELKREFEAVFGALPPTADPDHATSDERVAVNRAFSNIGKAIAAYERRLRTGPSLFDMEIERHRARSNMPVPGFGDSEQRGLKLFLTTAGCWRCHHGAFLSDGAFHSIGVPPLGGGLPKDRGRLDAIARLQASDFNAAGRYSDDPSGSRAQLTLALTEEPGLWGAVRTPSLRNVGRTAPYMHAGQFETLEEVVNFYNTLDGAIADHHGERVLEPLGLSDEQVADLVAFLRTLDGPLPDESLLRPISLNEPE
ncbi:MAG: c-type cytochrome [Phycisphaeraceae bacterium]|nr:c-type cytochrome [Phycisphaeraceae bacterium]